MNQVVLIDSAKEDEEEEEDSLEVVHRALSAIIGDEPREEQKLNLYFISYPYPILCTILI